MRLVVDRRAYESVARKNNVPVAGSPTDSVNGKRAWTSDELRSATVLEPGFTTGELIAALKATPWNHTQTATDAPILEFDFLGGDGSFCGFGDGDDGGGKKKKRRRKKPRVRHKHRQIALGGPVLLLHGVVARHGLPEKWRRRAVRAAGGETPLRRDGTRISRQGKRAPGNRGAHFETEPDVFVRVGLRRAAAAGGDRERPERVPETGRRTRNSRGLTVTIRVTMNTMFILLTTCFVHTV